MSDNQDFQELSKALQQLSDKGYGFFIVLDKGDDLFTRHNAEDSKTLLELGNYVQESINDTLSNAAGLSNEKIQQVIEELNQLGIENLEDFKAMYPSKYDTLPQPIIEYLQTLEGEELKYGLATASIINGVINESNN